MKFYHNHDLLDSQKSELRTSVSEVIMGKGADHRNEDSSITQHRFFSMCQQGNDMNQCREC